MFPDEIRTKVENERAEYDRRLNKGLVFTPSEFELSHAEIPGEFTDTATFWTLQPEYYTERCESTPGDAISAARIEATGNVFLVSNNGGQLNLGFTAKYSVVEYQNENDEHLRCAYSSSANLNTQVQKADHVIQACPCCGVGLLWYPSRYHMPRALAFSIFESVLDHKPIPGVTWLATDDFSYAQPGVG
ncbi:hypothetical protein NZK35_11090 [Stieleria sp. ICT_E10.1]|uniref:hypothetical protein n=1 Tax=Stieleria sedimenti TaxID=2976331 RepID=UPI0021805DF4|nr:hypothetical protein [Stieleria sedimenti]MCS7467188.1 hypothetical protein [Stieleria sedimenti]